ncbi:MAG: hypothetical protein KDA81_18460, partial [Planctomycetaceae bacterium]|nr:hypothetical protein [Planctomycetaceae bacterium]
VPTRYEFLTRPSVHSVTSHRLNIFSIRNQTLIASERRCNHSHRASVEQKEAAAPSDDGIVAGRERGQNHFSGRNLQPLIRDRSEKQLTVTCTTSPRGQAAANGIDRLPSAPRT